MELYIGSNIISNTTGVLTVHGREQITLELDRESGQILLNMKIYDSEGNHIAKLNRNAWSFNDQDRFDITTHPSELKLVDRESNEIVVEAKIVGTYIIEITQGEFFSHAGNRLKITPNYFSIDSGVTVSGNKFDGLGQAFEITSTGGIAIGVSPKVP
jgi:hypothetical protein